MAQDYYRVLGVERDATEKEIKQAYRKLARQYHPDVNADDEAAETRFKEVGEAYSVLGDSKKRQQYDRFGHAWEQAAGGPRPGPGGFNVQDFGFGGRGGPDLGDLFESLFASRRGGAQPRSTAPKKGENIEYEIEIPLREAVFGTSKTINIELDDPCGACGGQGQAFEMCQACGGTGEGANMGGFMGLASSCRECGGRGERASRRCDKCRGSGRVHRARRIEVKVPPGIDTGQKVRIADEGVAGLNGGPRGDLHLMVRVSGNGFFNRKGDDLVCEVPVTFAEAALGAKVAVPTKDGRAELTIPAGTQSGQVLRLAGMGVPHLREKGCGDQLVRVTVAVPKKLSRRQRSLLEELSETISDDPRAGIEKCEL